MEIVVGTKKWSSWSLRPWLALKRTGQPFKETVIELRQAGASDAEIAKHSPSHLVPVLKDGDLAIWDSLAICEYLAETFPAAGLWPRDAALRALGRSVAAEMHSGFSSLRGECPMALEVAPAAVAISEATQKDVRRIVERWNQLLKRSGGPFLLGDWSIADAFYTPVATRFRTYGIHLSDYGDTGAAGAYCERLLETPEFLAWEADSLA
ncbi:glutathione S-transferase family protein [Caulobacter sp. BK020]|uniref:glutathione S-transferase family protein n=1 Tax=Caulobacter sp. BK020 TaxID=2512117 RepID=UPI0010472AB8|nr:glutathione S-transferase family protein [Caulobacter sp. BK020]TCS16025.1 glutathione S-transferase [Caulobacter sp. BK020]